MKNPDHYRDILNQLLKNNENNKLFYVIQLFNRNYLNLHPSPDVTLINRYFKPRYILGDLYRDSSNFRNLQVSINNMQELIHSGSLDDLDNKNVKELLDYTLTVCDRYEILK